ncbi:hypothetical protein LTS10_004330 [Elasticomyces elasticus]|nr:hypothetical protein LTS10_004330 [Elasticomyces elasticus]
MFGSTMYNVAPTNTSINLAQKTFVYDFANYCDDFAGDLNTSIFTTTDTGTAALTLTNYSVFLRKSYNHGGIANRVYEDISKTGPEIVAFALNIALSDYNEAVEKIILAGPTPYSVEPVQRANDKLQAMKVSLTMAARLKAEFGTLYLQRDGVEEEGTSASHGALSGMKEGYQGQVD